MNNRHIFAKCIYRILRRWKILRKIEYTVTEEYTARPLLHFLKGYIHLSTHIVQSVRHTKGSVLVNGNFARVVDKVSTGDKVTVFLPEKTKAPQLWETELDILYEDDDLLIINKPSGISVHPTKNHPNGTLCNAVAGYLLKCNNTPPVARAVGRLDKVTSGVMIFAKNAFTASRLNGNLDKTYVALVWGETDESGTIDAPIYRPDSGKTFRAVGNEGDGAVTLFKTLETREDKSFLKIKTLTGRTHQIRVHCAHIGHPLLGDEMYGGASTDNINRAALHCCKVTITHPVTGAQLSFSAPLPEDIKKELEKSGFSVDKKSFFC